MLVKLQAFCFQGSGNSYWSFAMPAFPRQSQGTKRYWDVLPQSSCAASELGMHTVILEKMISDGKPCPLCSYHTAGQ